MRLAAATSFVFFSAIIMATNVASAGIITTGVSVTSQAGPDGGTPTTDMSAAVDSPTNAMTGTASASLTLSAPVIDTGAGTITYTGVASSTGAVTDVSTNQLSLDLLAECDFSYTFTATAAVNDPGGFVSAASLNLFVITRENGSVQSDFAQPDDDQFLNIAGVVSAGDTPTFGFLNRNQDDAPLIGGVGDGFDYSYSFELVFSNAAAGCVCSVPEPSSFLFLGMLGMFGCGWKRFFKKS